MNIKKLVLVAACAMSAYAGVATAATVDNQSTVTGEVSFTAPTNSVVGTITPVANLVGGALKNGVKVAHLEVRTAGSAAVNLAWRPTPTVGTFDSPMSGAHPYPVVTYTGKNDPAHHMTVGIGDSDAWSLRAVGNEFWLASTNQGSDTSSMEESASYKLNGDQTIEPDTYIISADVAQYHP